MVAELRAPAMSSHGDGGGQRDRSPRGRSRDSGRSLSSISSAGLRRSISARGRRSTSVPAANSPTAHRPGVDFRPQAAGGPAQQPTTQYYNVGTPPVPPPQAQQVPTTAGVPYEAAPNGQGQAFADLNLARQMLQAQDDQIRQQSAQLTQMGAMLTQALQLANQQAASAQAAQAAAAAASSTPVSPSQGAAGSGQAADSPTPMDVDTGLRSRRAESYIPTLPQLNYSAMTTRHAEIKVWTSYREELTSWMCLLDDRYAAELAEAETSSVEILQATLDVGKAARSTKLWFLLRQSLAKFQRAQDIVHLVEITQKGASAGYEFWRLLNAELSVRSRVEGQAMREQTLNLAPPKHLKRPLDIMRWFTTELLKFEAQISDRFPELKITEQEAVLHVLKFLDEDAKRYLLLHQTTSGLQPMMRGLQFYDEQLRVLNFQKEHHGFASAFGTGKDGKGKDGKGKDGKGKKGNKGKDGKPKSSGKTGNGKGDGKPSSGKGSSNREPSRAKKTDICRNCGKKGHWARDCWRPAKQASAVQEQSDMGATSSGSQAQTPNPKAATPQPTTKGDVGKGQQQNQQKGVRTFLEGSYFAMPSFVVDGFAMPAISASSVKHEEGIFWLLDSGSSYHVISRETLDCGHVKVLTRRHKPRTVCQTATGDLVEVGSDMHVTVEVSFLTTHPISAKSGHGQEVLSNYACTCRLEAVVSDQIKHNLINLNLLCWKGWKPTLHKGLLTAEQQGVVLLPHLYGDCTWLESVAPEHPSALYAGELMSSVVGRSVGRSVADSVGRVEKRVSFQSVSDVPKEEIFPQSLQVLQPQHVFDKHVHDHDVLVDHVEHVVDLRLVGQVGSQLASISEVQEQTMSDRQLVSNGEERCAVGQGSVLAGQSVVFTKEPPTKEHLGCNEDPQHACPVASVTPQRFSLDHDSARHLLGPTVQGTASVEPPCSSPVAASVSSVGGLGHQHVHVSPIPAVEHVGCDCGLFVGQSVGWLELDSGTFCSRQNKDLLDPVANGQQCFGARCYGPSGFYGPSGLRSAESGAAKAEEKEEDSGQPASGVVISQGKGHLCGSSSGRSASATSGACSAATGSSHSGDGRRGGSAPGGVGGRAPGHGGSHCGTDSVDCPFRGSSDREGRGGGMADGVGYNADHADISPEDGERAEPGGCNDHIAPGSHSATGEPHVVAGRGFYPHGGRSREPGSSKARVLVQMQALPEVAGCHPPAESDPQLQHARLHEGRQPSFDGRAPFGGNPSQLQGSLYRGICRAGPPQDCRGVPQDRASGEASGAKGQATAEAISGESQGTCDAKECQGPRTFEAQGSEATCEEGLRVFEAQGSGATCEESAGSFQAWSLDGGGHGKASCSTGAGIGSESSRGHGGRGRVMGRLATTTGSSSSKGNSSTKGGVNSVTGCSTSTKGDGNNAIGCSSSSRDGTGSSASWTSAQETQDTLGAARTARGGCGNHPEATWRELLHEDGYSASPCPDVLCRASGGAGPATAAAGGAAEPAQGDSSTSAGSGKFVQFAGTKAIGSSSSACSSAQANSGLAVQYSRATSGSEVLSERQSGPVKGVPTLSVCHSERQLGSEKGVPFLPVCQALNQVGQLVACPVCQSVVQSPGSQASQLRAQPDHGVGRSVCSSVCESCGSLRAAVADCRSGSQLAVADCRSGSRSVGRSLFPLQDNQLNNPIPQMQEPNTQPERGPAVVELERDVDPNLLLAVDDGAFGEIRSKRDELQHKMAGHVPFQGGCEVCSRARGLTPARKRASTNISTKEMQVDQFFYRKAAFVILVHTLSFSLAVAPRPLGESPEVTASHLEPWIRSFSIRDPEIKSDPEGLTKSIAAHLCNRMGGFEESFAPERHAPIAERGVRSLKGLVSTQILELRESGIEIPDGDELHEALGMLFSYAAHCHNRFQISVGSTMTPLQKVRGHKVSPQLTYPFGTVVFAKVSKSTKKDIDSKYARGAYLGPVLGSTGHLVQIRLDSGELKRIVAPGLKLLYPLRYDVELVPGFQAVEGYVQPKDGDRYKELHLPYIPGGGPPIDWVRQHGATPKCPGCSEAANSSRHSVRCVRRYQKWLRDAIDGALDELEGDDKGSGTSEKVPEPPAKRVRFGEEEVREFPVPGSSIAEGEVQVDDIQPEENPSEYQLSDPGSDEDQDLFREIFPEGEGPEPMEVVPPPVTVEREIRYLEELFGCPRFSALGLTGCDEYDLEAFCSLLVGRSSLEKLPYACMSMVETVGSDQSVVGSVACSSTKVESERDGKYIPIRDRNVWVSRPRVSFDDVDGIQLDNEESWQGMKTEVAALDSLKVGLVRSRAEVDQYQKEHPGCRVIKSRWVLTQKAPGLVRARLVAKDFAHGRPSALDLGLSSNTASVEALKTILSRAAKGRMKVWGLDISTAFLFASVVQPTVIELPNTFATESGETAYLILEKALYGLRSASLSWQRHLSKIMTGLGLKPSPLEPTLFSGWIKVDSKWEYVLALAYVDDLLIASTSQSGVEFIHKSLSAVLKVKVTGRLHEDGQLEFLGRLIKLDGNNIALGVKPEYVRSVFTAFGWTEKDLEKVKPSATAPDIRSIYDEEDPENPSKPLTQEAAGRYRSCLGKIGWLTQTRTDVTYFHSMLSRGQSAPRQVHEEALRKFLRWLVGCPLLDQLFPFGDGMTLESEGATLVAFCDSNWASEKSTGRKSTSGGVIYLVAGPYWYCVKGYSRLQSIVALSSAEAELFAIAEAAKEIAGLGQLIEHIWGQLAKPLAIYTDSASARQIAGMEGFLRRMRHVDLRLCFIQDRVHEGELVINGVSGLENVSDLLTKNLNRQQTLKHTAALGLENLHDVNLCAVPVVRSCLLLAGLLDSVFDNTCLDWERFVGLCELHTTFGTLLIEFCTDSNSSLSRLGADFSVFVLPVTLEVDGTSHETVDQLMSAMDVARSWGMKVVLWSSTPCTGGSPWQRKHEFNDNPQYHNHLQALFTVHRKLWKSWLKMNTHPQVSVWVIEWPQRCSYWGWQSTKSFLKTRDHHVGLVHGCVAGLVGRDGLLVKKIWKLVSNDSHFIHTMAESFACSGDHEHSQKFDLKATQHYPEHFAETALSSLRLS